MLKKHGVPWKGERKKEKPEREERAEVRPRYEEGEEPLPDALSQLEDILDEHGIRRKGVVIRALKLRDPSNLVELMYALDDIGVNRSRTRRIIRDYAKWLGVRIPRIVIERLRPQFEEFEYEEGYGWGREGFRRPTYEDKFRGIDPTALIINQQKQTMDLVRSLVENMNRNPSSDPELVRKVESLEKQLRDEREKRILDKIDGIEKTFKEKVDSLSEEIRNRRTTTDNVQIQALQNLHETVMEGVKILKAMGRPARLTPPVREESPESEPQNIETLLPKELIEET
jgi:hypothetical protein